MFLKIMGAVNHVFFYFSLRNKHKIWILQALLPPAHFFLLDTSVAPLRTSPEQRKFLTVAERYNHFTLPESDLDSSAATVYSYTFYIRRTAPII